MTAPLSGAHFPASELHTRTGGSVSSPGRETLYAIFHTECPTSEMAWPYFERLNQIGGELGLPVVGVSQDSPDETDRFAARLGLHAEMLFDSPPWPVSTALGLNGVPALALVGADGRLKQVVEGFQRRDLETLAARSAALAGLSRVQLFRPEENVPASRPG